MIYIIEDTDEGYQLSVTRSRSDDNKKMSATRATLRETGGHGRLEQLFDFAQRTYSTERAARLGESKENETENQPA